MHCLTTTSVVFNVYRDGRRGPHLGGFMRRALSWLIVSFAFVACRDVPQAPKAKSEADAALIADSANRALADSARIAAKDAKASKSAGASNTPAVISNISFPNQALVGQTVEMKFNFTDDAEDAPWFVSV